MVENSAQTFADRNGRSLNLVLYMFDSCPYCKRVLRRANELGMKLPLRDTWRDTDARDELLRVGGKTQVPCLFINGKPMYESTAIIAYLENDVVAQAAAVAP